MTIYQDDGRTESAAAIAKHPLHPFLVAFPIAFLIGALGSDVMFWHRQDVFFVRASLWLIGAGLLTGIIAATAGFIDFLAIKRARSLTSGWVHFIGNDIALVLALANLWLRWGDQTGATIIPTGIILSAAVVVIFGVTGWLGGELAYRHHIGMVGRYE